MEIPQNGAPNTGTRASSGTSGTAGALSSDFETFLKMLTVQLQNQDPLNPMESNDFSVQLATFAGVEQQVMTNELLAGLAERIGGSGLSQYAAWVGQEVRGEGAAYFDGKAITVTTPAVETADKAVLVVRDERGRVVDRQDIEPGGGEVVWNGVSETGDSFLTGLYSFTVESSAGGRVVDETAAEIRGTVREARIREDGGVELVLADGSVISPAKVTSLSLRAN